MSDMGVALSRAVQWVSDRPDKMENTPLNESILREIVQFTEEFSAKNPQEATIVFKEPLQWKTFLNASDFNTEYDIR